MTNVSERLSVTDPDGDTAYVETSFLSSHAAFVGAHDVSECGDEGAWLTADEADAFADRLKALAAQWRAAQ